MNALSLVVLILGLGFAALTLWQAADLLRTRLRPGRDPRPYPPRAADLVPPLMLAVALIMIWSITR